MDAFWKNWAGGGIEAEVGWFGLRHQFQAMDNAGAHLQKRLPNSIKKECEPQLKLFRKLAQADLQALQLLRMRRSENEPQKTEQLLRKLKAKNKDFTTRRDSARISDGVAGAFLEEAIRYVDSLTAFPKSSASERQDIDR